MKLFISIVLMLILSATGFAQQKIESDYAVYRDDKFLFSLFYPKDWTQLESSFAETRFKVTKEDGLYLTDFNINVIYVEASKNMPSKSFVEGLIARPNIIEARVKQGNPTAKIISSGKTYISNREALFIKSQATYRVLDEEYEMTLYQIITTYEGNIYTLTFRALTEEFDENFPIFKFIASSFVIRPTEITVPKENIQKKSKTPLKKKKT